MLIEFNDLVRALEGQVLPIQYNANLEFHITISRRKAGMKASTIYTAQFQSKLLKCVQPLDAAT